MPVDPPKIYQLKISLTGTSPLVWRRIQIPGTFSLSELHTIIQLSMGWSGFHLHGFAINGTHFGPRNRDEDTADLEGEEWKPIQTLGPVGSAFRYTYDFGDNWEHDIVVEEILDPTPDKKYPLCLGGEGACPPEDCGGPEAYDRLLKILANRLHPEREEMRAWVGRDFEPTSFDLTSVNARIRAALA